jgi:hypothetical protein
LPERNASLSGSPLGFNLTAPSSSHLLGVFYYLMERMMWFKFDPMMWLTGRIQRQSAEVQVAFIRLICLYWSEKCTMTIERAELECGVDEFQVLVKNKIVKTDDQNISITFLDDLFEEATSKSKKAKQAADKRWKPDANAMRSHKKEEEINADAMRSHSVRNADKTRQDKTREDKTTTNSDVADFPHYQTIIETELEVKPNEVNNQAYLQELLVDEIWQGSVMMMHRIKDQRLKDYLVTFYEHLITQSKQHQSVNKFRSHFMNWLNTQLSMNKEPSIKFEP